jgi:hypothetical protein
MGEKWACPLFLHLFCFLGLLFFAFILLFPSKKTKINAKKSNPRKQNK